ncbi:MAG: Glycosyl transferase, group 2 family [uncultured Propionibacteriaceae bacterium]|uniref:Glycosyl transferase, group 2 family n=1 Tax=uncultured Propionibacteriaceae bacterium TaxID=257457 RepID=A0A6J4NVP8_9ACTN|nr:MAG: Glycosyl transferase, group 2 family [uncultured Propionibacteriaceae bacterium]
MVALLLVTVSKCVLVFFIICNGFQTVLLVGALREMVRHLRTNWSEGAHRLLSLEATPRVTVLAPAFNEAVTAAASVRSLLTLHYPNLEVVVINDGSTDDTLEILKGEFDLSEVSPSFPTAVESKPVVGLYRSTRHRGLVVLDKVNGGKADSLNAGLNVATGELVCAIDADTLIEPAALLRIVRPFLTDDATVAAGATIRVVNDATVRDGRVVAVRASTRALPGIQTVEYLRSFLFGRLGWNTIGGNLIVSGAFGMFRRSAMIDTGGYRHDTVGEDMELVVRLRRSGVRQRGPSKVVFVPDPVAWTEVPESLPVLARQRERWQRGLTDVLWRHRGMLFNPRYGRIGWVAMPYFWIVELMGPAVEALGLVAMVLALAFGAVNMPFAVLFLLVAYGWGLLLTLSSLLLHQATAEEPFQASDLPALIGWSLAENLGYRQLTVAWRLKGTWRYLRGRRDWGTMSRTGFRPPTGSEVDHREIA